MKFCRYPTANGFVLWEVMLALTIFAVVAVALTTALQQTVDTSILLRDESQVRRVVPQTAVTNGELHKCKGDGRRARRRRSTAENVAFLAMPHAVSPMDPTMGR